MINYFIQMQNNDKKVRGTTLIFQHQKKPATYSDAGLFK